MKRFRLGEKQAIIAFRVILSILLLFLGVYARGARTDLLIHSGMLYWLFGAVGVQLATNLALAWIPARLIRKGWGLAFPGLQLLEVDEADASLPGQGVLGHTTSEPECTDLLPQPSPCHRCTDGILTEKFVKPLVPARAR